MAGLFAGLGLESFWSSNAGAGLFFGDGRGTGGAKAAVGRGMDLGCNLAGDVGRAVADFEGEGLDLEGEGLTDVSVGFGVDADADFGVNTNVRDAGGAEVDEGVGVGGVVTAELVGFSGCLF
jgi:hypothetical protein